MASNSNALYRYQPAQGAAQMARLRRFDRSAGHYYVCRGSCPDTHLKWDFIADAYTRYLN